MISSFQELVSSDSDQKNWKGLGIAILCILAILGCVVAATLALKEDEDVGGLKGRRVAVEDLLDSGFIPRRFNGSWISGRDILNIVQLIHRPMCARRTFLTFLLPRMGMGEFWGFLVEMSSHFHNFQPNLQFASYHTSKRACRVAISACNAPNQINGSSAN